MTNLKPDARSLMKRLAYAAAMNRSSSIIRTPDGYAFGSEHIESRLISELLAAGVLIEEAGDAQVFRFNPRRVIGI